MCILMYKNSTLNHNRKPLVCIYICLAQKKKQFTYVTHSMHNLIVCLDHVTRLRYHAATVWAAVKLAICDSCYAWLICSVLGSCFQLKSLYRYYTVFIFTIGTLLCTVTGLNHYTTSVNHVDRIIWDSFCSYQWRKLPFSSASSLCVYLVMDIH